jgi:rod shape-determining protein MreD
MRGTLVLFLTLFLLHALVDQANSALAGAHVHLFAAGLFVTYAALMLPFASGLAASLLAGLICDASAPVAFGTEALLFAAAQVIVFNLRSRLPREDPAARRLVALLVNAAVFVALSFLLVRRGAGRPAVWPRLGADLLASEAVVALVAPWFFALQAQSLRLARVDAA